MEFVGLRYFNVYGPRQDPEGPYSAVIPRFFRASLAGEPPVVFGDGEQSRDFTYVSDAVAANLASARAPAAACGAAYNIAGGKRTTVNELVRLVQEAAGGGPPALHVTARPGDIAHSLADLGRARAELGFIPEIALPEGLALSAPHYRGARIVATRPVLRRSEGS